MALTVFHEDLIDVPAPMAVAAELVIGGEAIWLATAVQTSSRLVSLADVGPATKEIYVPQNSRSSVSSG
jgi:hypothetical protein